MCIWHTSIAYCPGYACVQLAEAMHEPLQSFIHSSSHWCELVTLLRQVLLLVHAGHAGDV